MCAFKLLPVVSLRMRAFKSLLRLQLARLALAAHVCVQHTQTYIYGFLTLSLRVCAFKILPLGTCTNVCACDHCDALTAHVCVQIVFWLLPDALAAHVCVQICAWPPPAGPTYESLQKRGSGSVEWVANKYVCGRSTYKELADRGCAGPVV